MASKDLIQTYWHQLYIEMLANPTDSRKDKEFCTEIKIHPNTLSVWKNKHRTEIFAEVQKRRNSYLNEVRQKAWQALTGKLEKDTNALKLAFQLTGDLVERTESRVETMSRKDIVDRANSLLKEFNERQSVWKKVKEAEPGTERDQINPDLCDGALGNGTGENLSGSGKV